jgi:hypothetical protein
MLFVFTSSIVTASDIRGVEVYLKALYTLHDPKTVLNIR